ncbi:MAG: flagellar biosynthesis protein FlhB [Oscillospiraceae bacterium]|nr:flagellar biosynthesis protein FlhB [Oscillospiraceae bacterium]
MPAGGGESKTEKATPKKRKDERKKGHTFSSKDVVSAVTILTAFSVLAMLFPSIVDRMDAFVNRYLGFAVTQHTLDDVFIMNVAQDAIITVVLIVAPLMIAVIAAGVAATGFQTKFLISRESLKPKFNRMNPLQGIKRMVSLKSIVEIVKGLIKISIILVIIYNFFMGKINDIITTQFIGIRESAVFLLNSILQMVYSICIIFVFIAGLDYIYQWWEYERQIKMSKHEIKEEYKQTEGDPQVKSKIKEKQRAMSMSRMMQQVPSADVVIKNPTHYAVALKYDIDNDAAPRVVAMGADQIALRIIQVAEINDVYVMENKELARAIYASAEVNMEIPLEFYSAVAEVLALVYKIKEKQI